MRVKLRNQLFTGDRLFEKGVHEDFPDDLKHLLPKSAQTKFEDDEPAAAIETDHREFDVVRAESDELAKIEEDAQGRLARNQERIRARLASETKPK